MIFHRNAVWLIPLLALLTFPLWSQPLGDFLTPTSDFDESLPAGENESSHNFTMDMVKVLQNQEGINTAYIEARRARTDIDPEVLMMDEVDAELYDNDGNTTHIVAGNGTYHTGTSLLTLMDKVVVHKIRDGQTLYTDLLLYHGQWRTVRCPERVRLTGENVEIIGGSLDYDIPTETYEISEGVHCILTGYIEP